MRSEQWFYQLCASEIGVVLIGLVNIPVATFIQILVPLIIFRDLILKPLAFQRVLFISFFTLGTILFTLILSLLRDTILPILIMAVFTLLLFFVVIMAENRIKQHYNGVS